MELLAGDMFTDSLPTGCQLHLMSNVLHDWDLPEVHQLVANSAAALPPQGRLAIHDVYLNDDLAGSVLDNVSASDEVGIAQTHFTARRQAEELFGRILHEVVAL